MSDVGTPVLRRTVLAAAAVVLAGLPGLAAAPSPAGATPPGAPSAAASAAAAAPVSCGPGRVAALVPSSGASWGILEIDVETGNPVPVQTVVNPGGPYDAAAGSADDVNRLDALAVTVDGRYAYLTDSDARSVGQAPRIHKVDLDTGARTTFTGTALLATTPTSQPGISAGAINTATGIYYYAHAVEDSDNWLIYGWDTVTDTAVGVVGTLNAGGPNAGDLTFDDVGDLVLVASRYGETRFHRVAAADVPTAVSTTAMPATGYTTNAAPVLSGAAWSAPVGTFAAASLFLGVRTGGTGMLQRWVPGSGAAPTPTTIPLADGSTDLASCDTGDVITLRKSVTSRFAATDQFTVSISGGSRTASVTTGGTALGMQPGRATLAAPPGTYTLTETAASGVIADYSGDLSCTRRVDGAAVTVSGTGTSRTLDHAGGAVDCLWSNRSAPTLTVNLSVSLSRFVPSDQFTVQLRTGSPTGPPVTVPGATTTVGTTSTVVAGTGTTGQVRTTVGTTYHVGQTPANALTLLSNYTSTIRCTDPSGLQPGLPSTTPFTGDFSLQVVDGAQVVCVLDNVKVAPTTGTGLTCGPGEIYSFASALDQGLGWTLDRRMHRVLVSNPPPGTLGTATAAIPTQLPLAGAGYSTTNAAAISPGGRYVYYVAGKPAGSNDLPAVMRYDVAAGAGSTWTPRTFTNPSQRNITRGGLNATNGILYLSVTLTPNETQHDFWAYNTLTETMIGYVGRWTGPIGINGDLVFDQSGNMMFVAAGDLTGSLVRIDNMPTTPVPYGTDITASLTVRTMVSGASGLGSANGAAFDSDGHLYLSTPTITGLTGTSVIRRIDPNDGAVLATIPVAGMTDSAAVIGELADCNDPGSIRFGTDIAGRVFPTDQFNLVISPPPGSTDLGNRTTTIGNTSGLQPTVAGPVAGVPGRVYTLTEVATAGGSLANYDISVLCRDLNHDVEVPVTATGTVGVHTVTFPTLGADGVLAALDCTVTNTPTTRLTIRTTMGTTRAVTTDQFSVHARTATLGATDLPIVSPATNRVTAGTGAAVTANTGTTGQMPVTPGSTYQYRVTGAGTPTADLDRYVTTVTCTDTRSRQIGLPSGQIYTVPLEITPILGAHLNCNLVQRVETSIRLGKELARDRVDPADQFTVEIRNQAGALVGTGLSTTTGTGATVTTGTGSRTWSPALAAQTATLSESKAAGATAMSGYDTTIQCTNGWTNSTTVLPSGPGQSFTVTPVTGDRISCTLVNSAGPNLATGIGLLTVNGAAPIGGRMIKGADLLGYRISVSNTGKGHGSTVVSATVPPHTSFAGADGVWSGCVTAPVPSPAGTVCTRTVAVAPGATQTVDLDVRADADLAGVLSISAAVTSSEGSCATCSTAMATAAILTASKTLTSVDGVAAVPGQTVAPGQELLYTLTVTNRGGTAGTADLTETVPLATVFAGPAGAWTGCFLMPTASPGGTSCTRQLAVPAMTGAVPGTASTTILVSVLPTPPLGTLQVANTVTATAVPDGADLCVPAAPCTVQNPIRPAWVMQTGVSVVRAGVTTTLQTGDVARPGEVLTYEVTASVLRGTVTGLEIVDDLQALLDDVTLTGPVTLTVDGGPPQPVAPVGTAPAVQLRGAVGTMTALQTAVLRYQVTVGDESWSATLRNDLTGTGSVPPQGCNGFAYAAGTCETVLVTPAWVLVHNLGDGLNGPVDLDGGAFVLVQDDGGTPGTPLTAPAVEPTGAAGRFVVPGLDPGSYWLRQTRSPAGHSLLAQDVQFTVEVREDEPHTVITLTDTDPNSPVTVDASAPDTIQVLDTAPFALPFTGGPGTDRIQLLGLLILVVAVARFARWRRRSRG